MAVIKNRSELLFLYDVTNANPNGDPRDENKPRIDEETGRNFVTDVRLKRTIRDYLHDYKKQEIFILEVREDDGSLKSKEERLKEFQDDKDLLRRCIDVRLFGATTAVAGKVMTLTGPVQFKYGRSLHRVQLQYVRGTTVMPSGEGRRQGTFTERYILPYSLISFYGVVNENAAARQDIELTAADLDLLLEGMWRGTKNLMSASKTGQMPRLLLQVIYEEANFHLGELDKRVTFAAEKNDEEIRDVQDGKIELGELVEAFRANKEKIAKIRFKGDERAQFSLAGADVSLEEALEGLAAEKLVF